LIFVIVYLTPYELVLYIMVIMTINSFI